MNGNISAEAFAHNLSTVWASLPQVKVTDPNNPDPASSYYETDGLNHSLISIPEIMSAVESIKPNTNQQSKSLEQLLLDYPGVHDIVSHTNTGEAIPDALDGVVYYNQRDVKIDDIPYNYPGGEGRTAGTSGCAPLTEAMILSTQTGKKVTPEEMIKWNLEKGYRVDGGTDHDSFIASAEAWGLDAEEISRSYDSFAEALNNGALILINGTDKIPATPAGEDGHVFLVRGAKDGKFTVSDPYNVEKSIQTFTAQEILGPSSIAVAVYKGDGNGSSNQSTGNGQNQEQASQSDLQNFVGPISNQGYGLPVVVTEYVIGTKYEGYTNDGDGNVHTGLDILAKKGSPALAVRAGKVIGAGFDDGAGNYVKIMLDNNHVAVYEHLESLGVKTGDTVELGDQIGAVGNTGRVFSSTGDGTHLHLEINEEGFTGIASHTETVEQVESETLDPLDVLSSLSMVSEYIDEHHLQRLVGQIALDATDGLAEAGDTAGTLIGDTVEGVTGNGQEPGNGGAEEHQNADEQSAWNSQKRIQERLGSAPQHPAFSQTQAEASAD